MRIRHTEFAAFAITIGILALVVALLSILGLRGADDTPLEGDKTSESVE